MNSVIQIQAAALQQLCHQTTSVPNRKLAIDVNDLKAHLYLESMQLPVDVQDNILNAIARLKSVSTGKIMIILDHCTDIDIPDRMLH